MHPIPGYVFQSFNHIEASRSGHVIHLKLAVFSMQTQHANLTGSGDCIREGGVHRGVGLKRFREVATSRLDQLLSIQGLNVQW